MMLAHALALGAGGRVPLPYLPTLSVTRYASWYPLLMVEGYTGPLFRIRRESDNAEMDVYGAPRRPDYVAIDAWTGGSEPRITTVYDQEGGGKDWTQATAANQPYLSRQVTSNGVRPFGIWLQQVDGSSNRKFFNIPTSVAVNARDYGYFGALHPRSSAWTQVHYELYNGATAVVNAHTASGFSGLLIGGPQTASNLRPRAMPSAMAGTGSATARVVSLRGQSATISAHTAGTSANGGFVGKSTPGADAYSGMFDSYGMTLAASTPTVADTTAMLDALNSAFAFRTTGFSKRLIYGGSSLVSGVGSTKNNSPPVLIGLDTDWEVFALDFPGQSLANGYANRATREIPLIDGSFSRNVVVMDAPSNDIANATYADQATAESAAQTIYTNTTLAMVTALKAAHASARVVVPTCISRTAVTTANFKEYARLRYNQLVREGAATNGYTVADRCAYAPFDTTPTTAAFYTDLVHPNDTGYAVLAATDRAAILTAAA